MAANDEMNDDPLTSLRESNGFQPDAGLARARLRDRNGRAAKTARRAWTGAAVAATLLLVLALPWPRAAAERLWNRLTLGRVEIVEVDRKDLPESVTEVFTMQPHPWDAAEVASVEEAADFLKFRPMLPPETMFGRPKLSVVKSITLSTRTLRVSEIEQALRIAGVTDVAVPREWEGTTLVAEGGPVMSAEYKDLEIIQAAPFRMTTPAAFQFGQFMETAFRVFGRSAADARALGRKFAENPALVMHFPERGPVREVALRSGRGLLIGDDDDGTCFFWNAAGRIFIVSADKLTETQAAALANSLQ